MRRWRRLLRRGDAESAPEKASGSGSRRPFVWWGLAVATLALLALDLARDPARQLSAKALLAGIDLYQATLSRAMPGMGVSCRFEPTCSRYAEASIRRHGALVGGWRSVTRLARCGPWTPAGTVDPP